MIHEAQLTRVNGIIDKGLLERAIKSVSTRGPGRRGTCHLTDFPQTRSGERVHPKTPQAEAVRSLDSSKRI